MNILVLGISGMLGHVVYKTFAGETRFEMWGTDDSVRIERSLDSSRFRDATGYCPPNWQSLVQLMHKARD
jgi:dTDP-4-dehydrorhamnose reductase